MKNQDITVETLIKNMIAKTGENIILRRFTRYQLGRSSRPKPPMNQWKYRRILLS